MNTESTRYAENKQQDLIRILFICLTTFQLADWDSTVRGLQMGRQEQNVLITFLAGHIGIVAAVTFMKVLALILTWLYIKTAARRKASTVLLPLACITAIYALIVANNYF